MGNLLDTLVADLVREFLEPKRSGAETSDPIADLARG